jgi:hypothetical protein
MILLDIAYAGISIGVDIVVISGVTSDSGTSPPHPDPIPKPCTVLDPDTNVAAGEEATEEEVGVRVAGAY